MKKIKHIIVFSAIIVLLTGCIEENISRMMMFLSADEDLCKVVELKESSGKPMQKIQISNISEDFGDQLALEVIDDKDTSSKLYSPVLWESENIGVFNVPVHPSGEIKGGKVKITLMGSDKGSCELPTFTILAMKDSPGAYEKLVKLTDEVNKEQKRVLTGNRNITPGNQGGEPSIVDLPFDIVEEVIRGDGNENSLENIIEGKAPNTEGLTDQQNNLIDSLIEESKILDALDKYHNELETMDTFNDESNDNTSNSASNDQKKSLFCNLGIHEPSAKTLSRMMELQRFGEGVASYSEVMSSASTLLGAGVIVTTSTGVLAPAAPFLAKLGLSIYAIQTISGIMDGILPHDFVDIKSTFQPGSFKEDDDELTGEWKETMVIAQSKGYNIGEAVLSGLLQLSGTKAMGGLNMKWLSRFNDGKAVGENLTKTATKTMNSYVGEIINQATNGADFVQIPPCDFGPTDITSVEWSESNILNKGESPVEIIDHNQFSGHYEARDVGSATLTIETRRDQFANKSIIEYQEVGVLPIEVKVDPPSHHVEPGDVVIYTAVVANANDKSVEWTIEPKGGHTFTTSINGNDDPYIIIQSSQNPEDYPAIVRATSTSKQGLRGRPEAPPRYGEAMLGGTYEEVIVTPGFACVKPGETETFEAEIIGSSSNKEVVWSTDGGTISKEGLFKATNEKGEYTVEATSVVDSKAIGSAKVTVGDCVCTNSYSLTQDGIGTGIELFYKNDYDFQTNYTSSRKINLTGLGIKSSDFQSRIIREDVFQPENEADYDNENYGLLDGELAGLFFGTSSHSNEKDTPVTHIEFKKDDRPQLGKLGTFSALISGRLLTDDASYEIIDQPVTVHIDKFEELNKPHEAAVSGKIEGLVEAIYSKGDFLEMNSITSKYISSEELYMNVVITFDGQFLYPLPKETRMPMMRQGDMLYEDGLVGPAKRPHRMIACYNEERAELDY